MVRHLEITMNIFHDDLHSVFMASSFLELFLPLNSVCDNKDQFPSILDITNTCLRFLSLYPERDRVTHVLSGTHRMVFKPQGNFPQGCKNQRLTDSVPEVEVLLFCHKSHVHSPRLRVPIPSSPFCSCSEEPNCQPLSSLPFLVLPQILLITATCSSCSFGSQLCLFTAPHQL